MPVASTRRWRRPERLYDLLVPPARLVVWLLADVRAVGAERIPARGVGAAGRQPRLLPRPAGPRAGPVRLRPPQSPLRRPRRPLPAAAARLAAAWHADGPGRPRARGGAPGRRRLRGPGRRAGGAGLPRGHDRAAWPEAPGPGDPARSACWPPCSKGTATRGTIRPSHTRRTAATSSAVGPPGCQASPRVRARRRAARPLPPTQTSGGRSGRGPKMAPWNDHQRPWKDPSPRHSARSSRIASSVRAPRSSKPPPRYWYSGRCQPTPTPSRKRPPETSCRNPACLATWTGFRSATDTGRTRRPCQRAAWRGAAAPMKSAWRPTTFAVSDPKRWVARRPGEAAG